MADVKYSLIGGNAVEAAQKSISRQIDEQTRASKRLNDAEIKSGQSRAQIRAADARNARLLLEIRKRNETAEEEYARKLKESRAALANQADFVESLGREEKRLAQARDERIAQETGAAQQQQRLAEERAQQAKRDIALIERVRQATERSNETYAREIQQITDALQRQGITGSEAQKVIDREREAAFARHKARVETLTGIEKARADKEKQAAKAAAEEQRKAGQIVLESIRKNETASEKYLRRVKEIGDAAKTAGASQSVVERERRAAALEFIETLKKTNTQYIENEARAKQSASAAANAAREAARAEEAKQVVFDKSTRQYGTLAERTQAYEREADKLRQTLTQLGASQKQINNHLDGLREKFGLVEERQESTFGTAAVRRLAGYAAAYLGIQEAIQKVQEEFSRTQQALDAQVESIKKINEGRSQILGNEALLSIEDRKTSIAAAAAISQTTGVSQEFLTPATAAAISAASGKIDLAIKSVLIATEALKDRPEEIAVLAGALVDFGKTRETSDPLSNLGLFAIAARQGRIEKPRQQAENIATGVIGFGKTGAGASAEESTALFSALTQAGVDIEGQRTASGVVRFAEQLNKFNFGVDKANKTMDKIDSDLAKRLEKAAELRTEISRRRSSLKTSTDKGVVDAEQKLARAEEDLQLALATKSKRDDLTSRRRVDDAQKRLDDAITKSGAAPSDFGVTDRIDELSKIEDEIQLLRRRGQAGFSNRETRQKALDAFKRLDNIGRIRFLQQNKEFGLEFAQELELEAKLLAPTRKLITDQDSIAAKEFEANLKEFREGGAELTLKAGRDFLAAQKENPTRGVSDVDRTIATALEQVQTESPALSLTAEQIEKMKQIAKLTTGQTFFESDAELFFRGLLDQEPGKAATSAVEFLRNLRNRFEQEATTVESDLSQALFPTGGVDRKPISAGDAKRLKTLDDFIAKLTESIEGVGGDKAIEKLEESVKATEEMRDILQEYLDKVNLRGNAQ